MVSSRQRYSSRLTVFKSIFILFSIFSVNTSSMVIDNLNDVRALTSFKLSITIDEVLTEKIENKIKILLNTVSRDEYLCLLETMGYLLLLTQNHHMDYQQRQLYLHPHIQYQQSQEQYSFLPLESSML